MEELEKEFVDYTEALALKELGFDKPCFAFFNGNHLSFARFDILGNPLDICNCIEAPTYSQAFRWFREKYNIEVTVACFYSKRLSIPYEERQYHCHVIRDGVTSKGPKYKTYEKAELECLKKLIEIVKEK